MSFLIFNIIFFTLAAVIVVIFSCLFYGVLTGKDILPHLNMTPGPTRIANGQRCDFCKGTGDYTSFTGHRSNTPCGVCYGLGVIDRWV